MRCWTDRGIGDLQSTRDVRHFRHRRQAAQAWNGVARSAQPYRGRTHRSDGRRDRIHRISGKPPDVIPCLYRFLWLATHERETWLEASKIADVHGFLAFRLTRRWTTSTASADPGGALDMEKMEWCGHSPRSRRDAGGEDAGTPAAGRSHRRGDARGRRKQPAFVRAPA